MLVERLCVAIALSFTVACSTYAVPRYSVSAETVSTLRKLKTGQLNVGPFTATTQTGSSLSCRAVGPIKTPDGETFEEYIRKAFLSELLMADLIDVQSPVTITGVVTELEASSTGGSWRLGLQLRSSNGATLEVSEAYTFKSSWAGDAACAQTAQAALGAVQELIAKAVRDPRFVTLVGTGAVATRD